MAATARMPSQASATKNLNVVMIPTEFPSPPETFISGRVRTLRELGCSVSVHALRNEHPHAADMARERGLENVPRTHTVPATLLRGALSALSRPLLLAKFLAWVIGATARKPVHTFKCLVLTPRVFEILSDLQRERSRGNLDVVHAEWGHYPSLVLWLVQHTMPDVVTSIGFIAHDLDAGLGCSAAAALGSQLVRTTTKENVPQVTALTGVPEEDIAVIYDGVDVAAVDRVTEGFEKVPGRVAVVGRLIDGKRIDHVLRAFALAAETEKQATLHVLGDGPERDKLEQLARALGIAERTSFLGHVSHDEVIAELAQAEVLALLSASERLPNVVKEGMAARCVCITTLTNGMPELVEHGVTGFVLNHNEIDEAGRLIAWALTEREAARAMGAAARRYVGKTFDHVRNVGRFVDAWRLSLPHAQSRRR